ncbi:MAG TPA: tetratricopeptide repeat protein [Anaeromyxobacter sp.]|nr:tetratricopeptide repeat protein [Anaeromyxobacter sp.]
MRQSAAALARTAFALLLAAPAPALAFRDLAVGQPLPERTLPTLDGGRAPFLGAGRATVFVFIRSGQDHSIQALYTLGQLEKELQRSQVRFVAIASGSEAPEALRALVKEAETTMPVLIDEGDKLYGELGVSLHPSVGIADEHHRLAGYQPFRKINLGDAVRARVQLALGEIGEAQLAAVLDPGVPPPSDGRARARYKLGRSLIALGSFDSAVTNLRESLFLDPTLAEAHAALAEALAKQGNCAEAERERVAAQRLAGAGGAPGPLACAQR